MKKSLQTPSSHYKSILTYCTSTAVHCMLVYKYITNGDECPAFNKLYTHTSHSCQPRQQQQNLRVWILAKSHEHQPARQILADLTSVCERVTEERVCVFTDIKQAKSPTYPSFSSSSDLSSPYLFFAYCQVLVEKKGSQRTS